MSNSMIVHHSAEKGANLSFPDPHQDVFSKNLLGFWLYLMTDCILFGTLFIAYAVLHNNTYGGPSIGEIFDLRMPFSQTMVLLMSSFTCGLMLIAAIRGSKRSIIGWLILTLLLGTFFLSVEIWEFQHLIGQGYGWERSAFLSSFFTLIGTHGLHITAGILWGLVMIAQLLWQGLNGNTFRRLTIFSFFWHFLELVWIFVFTLVYLVGGVV